jgi:hypothetical protein
MVALAAEVGVPASVQGIPERYGKCITDTGRRCTCEDKHDGNTGDDWCCPRGQDENPVYDCSPPDENKYKTHDPMTGQQYRRPCYGFWYQKANCGTVLGIDLCVAFGVKTTLTCSLSQVTCSK